MSCIATFGSIGVAEADIPVADMVGGVPLDFTH
jgi:hypothetical protein